MDDAYIYDVVIKELMTAYFSHYSITSLNRAFDRILKALYSRNLIQHIDHTNHPQELVKFILALLLHTLVEHGQLDDIQRYSGAAQYITSSVCNIRNYTLYCPKLTDDFMVWTHMVLFLISVLRKEYILFVYDDEIDTTNLMDLNGTSDTFLSDVILILYGLLMTRLVIVALNTPEVIDRYNVESCMFLVIISFYYDYVSFTKNLSRTASMVQWELMLKQITTSYLQLGRFFITLKIRYDFQTYLHEDNIVTFYRIVDKHFLNKYRSLLTKSRDLTTSNIKTDSVIQHIDNVNLNSLSMTYNRWFRKIVYNKFFQKSSDVIHFVHGTIKDSYGGIRDAVMLGYGLYTNLYSDKWPVASTGAGVTVGIIAFAGKTIQKMTFSGIQWSWQHLVAATVYAFPKSELIPPAPGFQTPMFERPKHPGQLIWERSFDGRHSVIYNKTPLPGVIIGRNEPLMYFQRGGSRTKRDTNLKMLGKALKKGYIKYTLPIEMQVYLKSKLKINTNMKGGAKKTPQSKYDEIRFRMNQTKDVNGNNDMVDDDDDDEDDDILPNGWIREVIDTAEEEAFFREDPDGKTLQLVVPKTILEKDALENAAFIAVEDPGFNQDYTSSNATTFPPAIRENNLSTSKQSVQQILKISLKNTLPPPVDPAVSLPDLTEVQRSKLYEKTVEPRHRQFVKFTYKRKSNRRQNKY